jgi:hypothetical protein
VCVYYVKAPNIISATVEQKARKCTHFGLQLVLLCVKFGHQIQATTFIAWKRPNIDIYYLKTVGMSDDNTGVIQQTFCCPINAKRCYL